MCLFVLMTSLPYSGALFFLVYLWSLQLLLYCNVYITYILFIYDITDGAAVEAVILII